jgi:uncharacterized protein with FMN-binding domain
MKRVLTRMLVVIVALVFVLFWVVALYGGALNRTSGRLTLSPLDLANVVDGMYEGTATILHVAPKLHVMVTSGRITAIIVVSPIYGDVSELAARVIKAQSLDVDGISGATISTKAVLKAIDNALAARP